jgi:hypothetical protein
MEEDTMHVCHRYLQRLSIMLIVAGMLCSGAWVWANHNPGGGSFFALLKATNLRVGRFDLSPDTQRFAGTDEADAYTYVGTKGNVQAFKSYAEANKRRQGLGILSLAPAGHFATGATFYAEAASGSATTVWGAVTQAYTFSANRAAVGEEVDGWNNTTSTQPIVYGVNVVNGGNTATDAAVVIETSIFEPAGKPDYAIALAGPGGPAVVGGGEGHPPASVTGILVDNIVSQEAIRIMENQRIVLNQAGDVYIHFNTTTNRVEFVRHGLVVGTF